MLVGDGQGSVQNRGGAHGPPATLDAAKKSLRGKSHGPIELHKLMGLALFRLTDFNAAIPHLERAVMGGDDETRMPLARCRLLTGDLDGASALVTPALSADPANDDLVGLAAVIELRRGEPDAALAIIERSGVIDASLSITRAQALAALGDPPGAIATLEPFADDGSLPIKTRAGVLFELALPYDADRRYDDAFACCREANELARQPYDPLANAGMIGRLIEMWTPDALAAAAGSTRTSERPVFIVGMPRSGMTLVERMLTSHADVHGAGELSALGRLVGAPINGRPPTPAALDRRAAELLADEYLDALAHSAGDASRVSDKQPLNFVHLGWISLLLPRARVIHCTRDARDTGLSCYFRMFRDGLDWTGDLAWIGAFHRDYERMMAHWTRVLPATGLRMTTACYEDLVADPEKESARLLSFIGLEPSEPCGLGGSARVNRTLRFDQHDAGIYSSSVGRWKNYERHLGALFEALGNE